MKLPYGDEGLDRFFLAGWSGSLALLLIPYVLLFFAFGYFWPYWRAGDMDIWMVYEAFLLNDGLRQEYFDHPAFFTILSLGQWFKLLHAAGLLPIHSLSALPPVADVAASELAWTQATRAARVLSLILALGFLTSFAFLMRALMRDWRIAMLATFMLAFSGGLMMEARIVRTELIAVALAYAALLILLLAARRADHWRVPLIGLASLLAMLAALNKIHVIFLLMTFPVVVFVLAEGQAMSARRDAAGGMLMVLWLAAAVALAAIVAPSVIAAFHDPWSADNRFRIFGTRLPFYQTAIAAWFALWIVAYAIRFRAGAVATIATMAAVVAGVALGLLAVWLRFDLKDIVVVVNPIEQMLSFAPRRDIRIELTGGAIGGAMLDEIVSGVGLLLARQTFFFSPSPRPAIFLEWAIVAGAIVAWRAGERKAVLQVAFLVLTSWAVDLVGTFRGYKLEYFILTDPLLILAAAWLLARVPALHTHRLTFPVGAALIVATMAVGLAEPVKHSFKRDKPFDFCVPHYPKTKRIETFSFCPR